MENRIYTYTDVQKDSKYSKHSSVHNFFLFMKSATFVRSVHMYNHIRSTIVHICITTMRSTIVYICITTICTVVYICITIYVVL